MTNNIQKSQLLEIENKLMQNELKHLKCNMIEKYDAVKMLDKIDPKWKNQICEIIDTHSLYVVWNSVTQHGTMISETDGQFTGGCYSETWEMDNKIYSMSFYDEKMPIDITVYSKE